MTDEEIEIIRIIQIDGAGNSIRSIYALFKEQSRFPLTWQEFTIVLRRLIELNLVTEEPHNLTNPGILVYEEHNRSLLEIDRLNRLREEQIQSALDTNTSVIRTNENVISTNLSNKIFAASAAIFTLATLITTTLQYCKPLKPDIQETDSILQRIEQKLEHTKTSLQEINSSIRELKKDTSFIRVLK